MQKIICLPKFFLPFFVILIVLMGVSCSRQAPVYHEQILSFGTLIDVKFWGVDENTGRRAANAITEDFEYMHFAWHAWNPGPLSRINELLPSGNAFTVAPSVMPLIQQAKTLSQQSQGKFNPAIGHLIHLWGFASDDAPKGPPPAAKDIDALLAKNPTMADIELQGIQIRSNNPAVRLDFGGFAKGYGVDKVIEHLRELGIKNAVVNAGGDLRAIGRHGDRPWRIGIRNPRGEGILASVDVADDESVFTSGDYERFFEYEGVRYYHIIDPETGYPARGATSVTVFHEKAAQADAAATALFVAGPEEWYDIAKSMGVKGVLLIDTRGTVHMTPNLKSRIHFTVEPLPQIIYSMPL